MAKDIIFRAATLEDAEAIAALHAASWKEVYAAILDPAFLAGPVDEQRRSVWNERLSAPSASQHVILAEQGDDLLGFVCAYRNRDPVWGSFIDNLHVAAAARGRGIGTALMAKVAGWASTRRGHSSFYLWVFEANESARRFYERKGGRAVEIMDDTAPDGSLTPSVRFHWPDAGALLPRRR
jgi:GNAT superfamily N-acetyltransferase